MIAGGEPIAPNPNASHSADTLAMLTAKGHTVRERQSSDGAYQGDAETIAIDPKTNLRLGAADPRKPDSRAVGY